MVRKKTISLKQAALLLLVMVFSATLSSTSAQTPADSILNDVLKAPLVSSNRLQDAQCKILARVASKALIGCSFYSAEEDEETLEGIVLVAQKGSDRSWALIGVLQPPEAHPFSHCGWSGAMMSVQGSGSLTILVSCLGMTVNGNRRVGVTFVYENDEETGWHIVARLVPQEAGEGAHCGWQVSFLDEGTHVQVTCRDAASGYETRHVFFCIRLWNEHVPLENMR